MLKAPPQDQHFHSLFMFLSCTVCFTPHVGHSTLFVVSFHMFQSAFLSVSSSRIAPSRLDLFSITNKKQTLFCLFFFMGNQAPAPFLNPNAGDDVPLQFGPRGSLLMANSDIRQWYLLIRNAFAKSTAELSEETNHFILWIVLRLHASDPVSFSRFSNDSQRIAEVNAVARFGQQLGPPLDVNLPGFNGLDDNGDPIAISRLYQGFIDSGAPRIPLWITQFHDLFYVSLGQVQVEIEQAEAAAKLLQETLPRRDPDDLNDPPPPSFSLSVPSLGTMTSLQF